jgi:hypothetical protein
MTVLLGYSWVFWLPLQYLHMWLCCWVTRESSDYPYSIYICDCVVRLLVSLLITPTVSTYVTVVRLLVSLLITPTVSTYDIFDYPYSIYIWYIWLPLQYLHMIYLIIPTVSTYDLFSYLRYSECKNGYIVNYIEFALLLALIRHLKNKLVFLCRTLYCLLLIK